MADLKITNNSINFTRHTTEDIKNSILLNANQMINLNGKIDIDILINDFIQTLDKKVSKSNKNYTDIKLFKKDTEKQTLKDINSYINYLKKVNDDDISNITADDLKNKAIEFNLNLLNVFLSDIKINAIDLIDTSDDYASNLASVIADLQMFEIKKIGIDAFIKLDLETDTSLKQYMQITSLKNAQKDISDELIDISDDATTDALLKTILFSNQLYDSILQTEHIIENNKKYYVNIHKKYKTINKLIKEIDKKYTQRDNELSDVFNTNTDNAIVIKKDNIKIPKIYDIDFDIMKLFNNIYPNYKYKSIDDNRHKDLDIKAKLMLDLDVDTEDITTNMQNMRIINFISSGNITLYPIQNALINGFIKIRDNQDTIDKVIPLLSTLKYITDNNTLRLPTNKKDLALYEDFMLFFDKCKIQVKITNRKTKDVLFEITKPIPLLSNTPAYNGKYGYVIGNSVINLLKNELDNIYETPHQTTIKANKGYLSTKKLPTTPPTINLTQTIYSKIAQMINSYKTKQTYQPKINIISLYDFQALYNKRHKPNKDDKSKVREMLNKYLDSLIDKGLIKSYTPINEGKEINQYKIEINRDANL